MTTKQKGVLIAAFIMSFIPTGMLNNCFALFMNPVCTDLGFSTGAWSMVNLIGSLTSAIGAMVIAGLYQKKNMSVMMVACTIGTAACFILATFCTKIWMFYIIFGLENIFLAGLTQLPISMLVTAWFESKRSTYMSVAMCGGGLGGLIWSPVLTKFITADVSGWKTAMLFAGILTLVVMTITALFLVKRSPQEFGEEPYRIAGDTSAEDAAAAQAAAAAAAWQGVSKATAKKSGAWKASIAVVMLIGALASGVTTHVPNFIALIADQGMSGTILSAYSIVSMVAMLGGGVLMDKIGIKNTVLACVAVVCVGLVCLVMASTNAIFAYGYCVFFALGMCMPKLVPAVLFSEVFGTKDYGSIYANLNLFFLIGAALGSVLTGILQGIIGYQGAWIVYIVMAVLFFLSVSASLKGGAKLREEYPNGDDVEVAA